VADILALFRRRYQPTRTSARAPTWQPPHKRFDPFALFRTRRSRMQRPAAKSWWSGLRDLFAPKRPPAPQPPEVPVLRQAGHQAPIYPDDFEAEIEEAAPARRWSEQSSPIPSEDLYLAVHGVEKSFAKRKVVKGVSLYLRRGEAVGLLGPNGAGDRKSVV